MFPTRRPPTRLIIHGAMFEAICCLMLTSIAAAAAFDPSAGPDAEKVNEAFLVTSGFSRDEVLGHTTAELELWVDPAERGQFLRRVREHGVVRSFEAHMPCSPSATAESGSRIPTNTRCSKPSIEVLNPTRAPAG